MRQEKCIKIGLNFPIPGKNEGETIDKIRLSRLKCKHLHLLPKNVSSEEISPADMIPLIAAMADLPVEIINEIDFADLNLIVEKAESFFDISQKNGEN